MNGWEFISKHFYGLAFITVITILIIAGAMSVGDLERMVTNVSLKLADCPTDFLIK